MTNAPPPASTPWSGQHPTDQTQPLPAPIFLDAHNQPFAMPVSRALQPAPQPRSPSPSEPAGLPHTAEHQPWSSLRWLVAALVTVGVLGGVIVAANRSPQPLSTSAATAKLSVQPPVASAAAAASSPVATPQISAEQLAKQRLDSYLAQDSNDVESMMDGRFVAKLAAKTDNTFDPLQTTSSGSHTFHWVDVLAEHERFRNDPGFGSNVRLLQSSQIGDGIVDKASGRPYMITIVNGGFSSAQNVVDWCNMTFADLSLQERNDTCLPATMTSHNG